MSSRSAPAADPNGRPSAQVGGRQSFAEAVVEVDHLRRALGFLLEPSLTVAALLRALIVQVAPDDRRVVVYADQLQEDGTLIVSADNGALVLELR